MQVQQLSFIQIFVDVTLLNLLRRLDKFSSEFFHTGIFSETICIYIYTYEKFNRKSICIFVVLVQVTHLERNKCLYQPLEWWRFFSKYETNSTRLANGNIRDWQPFPVHITCVHTLCTYSAGTRSIDRCFDSIRNIQIAMYVQDFEAS